MQLANRTFAKTVCHSITVDVLMCSLSLWEASETNHSHFSTLFECTEICLGVTVSTRLTLWIYEAISSLMCFSVLMLIKHSDQFKCNPDCGKRCHTNSHSSSETSFIHTSLVTSDRQYLFNVPAYFNYLFNLCKAHQVWLRESLCKDHNSFNKEKNFASKKQNLRIIKILHPLVL